VPERADTRSLVPRSHMAIHIGLIGGGNITDTHAAQLRAIPESKSLRSYGTNPEKLATLCREYGENSTGISMHSWLTRPMNLVAIGSPSGLHATHGIAAAQRGLHVLTEKTYRRQHQARGRPYRGARRSGVKLGVIVSGPAEARIWPTPRVDPMLAVIGKPLLADARVKWYRPPEYYGQSRWRGTLALTAGAH